MAERDGPRYYRQLDWSELDLVYYVARRMVMEQATRSSVSDSVSVIIICTQYTVL